MTIVTIDLQFMFNSSYNNIYYYNVRTLPKQSNLANSNTLYTVNTCKIEEFIYGCNLGIICHI